jgi:hypothetical protein
MQGKDTEIYWKKQLTKGKKTLQFFTNVPRNCLQVIPYDIRSSHLKEFNNIKKKY